MSNPDLGLHCRTCGETDLATRRFCPTCGELYPAEAADRVPALAGPLLAIAEEIRPLLREKGELARRLEALSDVKRQRVLDAEELQEWERVYARWRDVTFEITLAIDQVLPRGESDRRASTPMKAPPPEPPPGEPARSADDRRDPFWHRAP